MHKVSVIIPNYNRAKVITDTLEAVLNQTLKPYEVIVVDDGSTDNSVEVLKTYGSKIKLIRQENQGPARARNNGLKHSTGDFISFMDSDDIPSLNKLEVQLKQLLKQNADVVIGPWYRVNFNENKTIKGNALVLQQKSDKVKGKELACFLKNWSFVFQQTLIKRNVYEEVGLYDENLILTEDADLSVRIFASHCKVVYENESLLLYRLDDHAKLTSSGISNIRTVENHCKWLLKVINMPETKDVVQSKLFQKRLYSWITDYKRFSLDHIDHDLLNSLESHLQLSNNEFQVLKLFERLSKGIKFRISGHRWSKYYGVGRLDKNHRVLIEALGFKLL